MFRRYSAARDDQLPVQIAERVSSERRQRSIVNDDQMLRTRRTVMTRANVLVRLHV